MRYPVCLTAVVMAWLVPVGVPAAEPAPAPQAEAAPATTGERLAALEKQVQTLLQAMVEKDNRIAELQRKVDEMSQRQPGMQMPGFQFRGTPQELDQMLRNWQREFFRDDPAEQDEFAFPRRPWRRQDPMELDPRRAQPGLSKPRLGVSLQDATPDLADRFGNEVKTGAFVIQVVPLSPAHKSGLMVGDCITAFDQRPVLDSRELIEMVRKAAAGKHDISLKRRGEDLVLSVQLDAQEEADNALGPRAEGGWLKRGGPGGGMREVLVVRASALELTPRLAEALKLNDEQHGKMKDVLAKHAKQLSEDYSAQEGAGRGLVLDNAGLDALVERHLAEAEKELVGVLDEQQLKTWRVYRKINNRTSVSRSLEQEHKAEPEGLNF